MAQQMHFGGLQNMDNSMDFGSEQGSQGGLMMNNSIMNENDTSMFGANRGYQRRGTSINVSHHVYKPE